MEMWTDMPEEKGVHSTLARVYEELGQPTAAARHRSLAEGIAPERARE